MYVESACWHGIWAVAGFLGLLFEILIHIYPYSCSLLHSIVCELFHDWPLSIFWGVVEQSAAKIAQLFARLSLAVLIQQHSDQIVDISCCLLTVMSYRTIQNDCCLNAL